MMIDKSQEATAAAESRVLDDRTLESIKRHLSGATLVHRSPFQDLPVPVCREEPSQEFYNHWVVPLYVTLHDAQSDPVLESRWTEMNRNVAYALLAVTNWRPRAVGAYIVAVRQLHELTEDVGRLLLRSDVALVVTIIASRSPN